MASNKKSAPQATAQPVTGGETGFQFNTHYLRDLSFENPQGPVGLFTQPKDKPSIDLNVDLKAQRLNDNSYELIMIIAAKAVADGKPLFLAEVQYAGIFTMLNEQAMENAQYLLLAEAPYALFPYARRVISDVTRDGGFPPLMLDGVDFRSLYETRMQSASQKANA